MSMPSVNAAQAERVHVIVGLRADFYSDCLAHDALKPFLEQNYSVLLMKPAELREAIESGWRWPGSRRRPV